MQSTLWLAAATKKIKNNTVKKRLSIEPLNVVHRQKVIIKADVDGAIYISLFYDFLLVNKVQWFNGLTLFHSITSEILLQWLCSNWSFFIKLKMIKNFNYNLMFCCLIVVPYRWWFLLVYDSLSVPSPQIAPLAVYSHTAVKI